MNGRPANRAPAVEPGLHLILGVAMIGLGLWLGRDAVETNAATKESTA
jgi:hypothetical protein